MIDALITVIMCSLAVLLLVGLPALLNRRIFMYGELPWRPHRLDDRATEPAKRGSISPPATLRTSAAQMEIHPAPEKGCLYYTGRTCAIVDAFVEAIWDGALKPTDLFSDEPFIDGTPTTKDERATAEPLNR